MAKYTREDVIRIVREKNVHLIRMQFTDIFGQLKNVTLPASQIEKAVTCKPVEHVIKKTYSCVYVSLSAAVNGKHCLNIRLLCFSAYFSIS